jgi:hypothetical protein
MNGIYVHAARVIYVINGARYEDRQFVINRFGLATILALPVVVL